MGPPLPCSYFIQVLNPKFSLYEKPVPLVRSNWREALSEVSKHKTIVSIRFFFSEAVLGSTQEASLCTTTGDKKINLEAQKDIQPEK